MTATITFDLSLLYFVAMNVIGILTYVLAIKFQARRYKRKLDVLTNAIKHYFRITGCEVSVKCVSLTNDKHVVAFIDTEPMKRFRLSHMIEMSLMDHISRTCDLKLDNVYWRFMIKDGDRDDDYMRDGLAIYEVEESTLEAFHTVSKIVTQ